jgi:hypothetical protein
MTETEPHVPAETEAALAALLDEQRRTLPWLTAAHSVLAPSTLRARLVEPGPTS